MDGDEYVESGLQRNVRMRWQRVMAVHPDLPYLSVCVLAAAGALSLFPGLILAHATGLVAVDVVCMIAVACIVSAAAILLLTKYVDRQQRRFDEYQRRERERVERERAVQKPRMSRDPDLSDDEFYRQLVAVKAHMHGHPAEYVLESQIAAAIQLAGCDIETFQCELARAGLARHYN